MCVGRENAYVSKTVTLNQSVKKHSMNYILHTTETVQLG